MTEPAVRHRMTYAEYLAAELHGDVKHEYLRGEVFAMAGGTIEHARLAAALIAELRAALRGKGCEVYSSDVRVRIVDTDRTTYPDVTVVCGRLETAADDRDAIVNPVVLVEILSDSTEASYRGEKFSHYQHLPSLREYVLVSQKERRIELFRRGPGPDWTYSHAEVGQALRLDSIGVDLRVDDVYRAELGT